MPTHYEILGIKQNATADAIKKQYIKLARQHHPDKAGPGSTEKFQQIQNAYSVLSDAEQRREYDSFLAFSKPLQKDNGINANTSITLYNAVVTGDISTINQIYTPVIAQKTENLYHCNLLRLTLNNTKLNQKTQRDIISAFLQNGLNPNTLIQYKSLAPSTPLFWLTVFTERPDMLQVFLDDRNTNLNLTDKNSGQTVLEHAFAQCNFECVNKLLEKINPGAATIDAMIARNYIKIFYYKSPRDNKPSFDNKTFVRLPALICVAIRYIDKENDAVKIVTKLLEMGADVNIKDAKGLTALDYLMQRRTYTLDYDEYLEINHSPGNINQSFTEIIKLLIERGAHVNNTYEYSYYYGGGTYKVLHSPLIDAVRFSDLDSVKIFLNENRCTPPTLKILNHAIAEIGVNRPHAKELQKLLTDYRTKHYLYVPNLFSKGYYVHRDAAAQHPFAAWYENPLGAPRRMWQNIKRVCASFVASIKEIWHTVGALFVTKPANPEANTTTKITIEQPSNTEQRSIFEENKPKALKFSSNEGTHKGVDSPVTSSNRSSPSPT